MAFSESFMKVLHEISLDLCVDIIYAPLHMTQDEYRAMWDQLFGDSIELATRRTELENELNEVKVKIENVEQALQYIRPLAGVTEDDNLGRLGMTDAIRAILKKSRGRMSATDVRKALSHGGFDLSGYSAPMSSIYTVLGRLTADDDSGEVLREQDDSRNVFYRWKANDELVQSTDITDDDIPF